MRLKNRAFRRNCGPNGVLWPRTGTTSAWMSPIGDFCFVWFPPYGELWTRSGNKFYQIWRRKRKFKCKSLFFCWRIMSVFYFIKVMTLSLYFKHILSVLLSCTQYKSHIESVITTISFTDYSITNAGCYALNEW